MPLAHDVLSFRQLLAPSVRRHRLLSDIAVKNRPPTGLGELRADTAVAAELDNTASDFVCHGSHRENLFLGGEISWRQPAIPIEMAQIALEGDADSSGLQSLADDSLHRRNLVIGGVPLLRIFAHHV